MITKEKQEKGVTLIALVVTIVVLIILSGVTISTLIGNNGVITKAKEAKNKTEVAGEIEKITLAMVGSIDENYNFDEEKLRKELEKDFEYRHDSYISKRTKREYKITEEGKVRETNYEEDLLERGMLGKEKNGRPLGDLINADLTLKKNDIIPDMDTRMQFIRHYGENKETYAFIKYNGNLYEIKCIENENKKNDLDQTTQHVKHIYTPKGIEGTKVRYSASGLEKDMKEWLVLYDYGNEIEIVPKELSSNKVRIGFNSSGDISNSIFAYNNVENILNRECEKLITNPNKISVRSIGSNPKHPDFSNSKKVESELLYEYNGKIKDTDHNIIYDSARLDFFNENNYLEDYWLASRVTDRNKEKEKDIGFFIRKNKANALDFYSDWFMGVKTENNGSISKWSAYREEKILPVVRVNKDAIK